MLLIVALIFNYFSSKSGVCVAGKTEADGFVFVLLLGLVVLFRDIIDYFHAWPVLYPVENQQNQIERRPMLNCLICSNRLRICAFWFSFAMTALSL